MRRTLFLLTVVALGFFSISFAGCAAVADLRNTNLRLKEANGRLVSDNHRLKQELALSERELAAKNREFAALKESLDKSLRSAKSTERKQEPTAGDDDFKRLGLATGKSSQGTWVRLDSAVFFPPGKTALTSKGLGTLDRVAQILNSKHRTNTIRVEGHTDDLPIKKVKRRYPSNWELSAARACSVVRYLVKRGVDPHRIYAAGFSKYKPLATGTSSGSRSKNRRVEILIVDDHTLVAR